MNYLTNGWHRVGMVNGLRRVTFAALALGWLGAAAADMIEVSPKQFEFKTIHDSATLTLLDGGQPVPASAIQSVKLYVGDHDYDHMIHVEKRDGTLTVQPTEMLELGSYDLAIKTTGGDVHVPVLALLEIVKDDLEARAKRQGVSVDTIRAQLGVSHATGRERVDLNLPKIDYLGRILEMKIPLAAGRTAHWQVDGHDVTLKDGALHYVFDQPGVHDFAYLEKQGGATVAVGLGTVQTAPEPKIPVSVAKGTQLKLLAPAGFKAFEWKVNGNDAGSDSKWSGAFEVEGDYQVIVRASDPEPGNSQAFRIITYAVTVP